MLVSNHSSQQLTTPSNGPNHSQNMCSQANQEPKLTVQTDTLTLSSKAIALSNQDPISQPSQTRPDLSERPNNGEKAEAYVQYKKAMVQYQIYADMANIATGSNSGISPATAYYLSKNDDARAATVNAKSQQHQIANMQIYVKTSQSSMEGN